MGEKDLPGLGPILHSGAVGGISTTSSQVQGAGKERFHLETLVFVQEGWMLGNSKVQLSA